MSSASEESWEELAKRQLAEFTVTTQKYRAENQRLREALERIEALDSKFQGRYILHGECGVLAREALAGDTP